MAARRRGSARSTLAAFAFLLPALVLLGALVVWPIVYTVVRSFYDRSGDSFVGVENYADIFTSGRTLTALRNNVIWVVVAPSVVTAFGLVFAVLSERVRWATAFKVVVFMPMAISFLAAGIIFRLVYETDPDRGVANAVIASVRDVFTAPAPYPGARTRPDVDLRATDDEPVLVPMVGVPPASLPEDAAPPPTSPTGCCGIRGIVWLDVVRGGGGEVGVVDRGERGMPGMRVELVAGDDVVDTAITDERGAFALDAEEVRDRSPALQVRLAESNFREPFGGVRWLGPTLVTPAVIGAYVWIWAGFAMVVIAAGLAAIPREVLEAARVDGAGEWQVFRKVTVPLLAPVLAVVVVTLVINVLKVFDLVLVIPPASLQDDANVVALEMWRVSFAARNHGLGSALGVFLFALVLPAMLFNVRRFRRDAA